MGSLRVRAYVVSLPSSIGRIRTWQWRPPASGCAPSCPSRFSACPSYVRALGRSDATPGGSGAVGLRGHRGRPRIHHGSDVEGAEAQRARLGCSRFLCGRRGDCDVGESRLRPLIRKGGRPDPVRQGRWHPGGVQGAPCRKRAGVAVPERGSLYALASCGGPRSP
jgi:hypothetical protein